jgi:Arc/MetJ family transcription regulator
MPTTITIDDELYRQARTRAFRTGRTVSGVIEDAVREALGPPLPEVENSRLPRYGGSGVQTGVDLADSTSLQDAMDVGIGVGPDPRL